MKSTKNQLLEQFAQTLGYAVVRKMPSDYVHTANTVYTIDTFEKCQNFIDWWNETDARMRSIGIEATSGQDFEIVPVSRLHHATRRAFSIDKIETHYYQKMHQEKNNKENP